MRKSLLLFFLLVGLHKSILGQQPEIAVESGLPTIVSQIAYSSNGKLLASAGFESTKITLWDVESGIQLRSLAGHRDDVISLAVSPDGKTLASGSYDYSIKLWNILTGENFQTITDDSDSSPELIKFSVDGKSLICAYNDDSIKLLNVESGKVIKSLKLPQIKDFTTLSTIAFSSDLKTVVQSDESYTARLWNLETLKVLNNFSGHTCWVKSAAFSPDGNFLATGSCDNFVKIWDLNTGKELQSIDLENTVNSISFSPDGNFLAIAGEFSSEIWDISTKKEKCSIENKGETISFSPDGKSLAIGSYEGLQFWNIERCSEIRTIAKNSSAIDKVLFSRDGKILAIQIDEIIELWDTQSGQPLTKFKNLWSVHDFAFSPDGKSLIVSNYSEVKFWDIRSQKEILQLEKVPLLVSSFSFSPDGKVVAARGIIPQALHDGSTYAVLWDAKTGRKIHTFREGRSALVVVFSPNGKIIAIGNGFEAVIWDAKALTKRKVLKDASGRLVFSPDSGKLASLGNMFDPEIRVWDIKTGAGTKLKEIPDWGYFNDVFSVKKIQGKTIRARYDGNQVELSDFYKKQTLAVMTFHDKTGWLISTPKGFFDGTPNSWKQLIWRFNNNTFDYNSVELYFNDFFYPNLLQEVLAGKSPKAPAGSELEKKDRRQPKVGIVSINGQSREQIDAQPANRASIDKRIAAVAVEVTDNNSEKKQPNHNPTSGAQDLRLFRNGSLVKVWHGDVFALGAADGCEKVAKPNEARRVRCRVEAPVVAGVNNFTAYAFNSQNVKSNDDSISINGADSLKRDGTLYVLAIGVNKYTNTDLNLNFAVPDVEEIGAAIKSQQAKLAQDAKLKQYARTEVITLKDENATKENILLALRRFSKVDAAALPENLRAELKNELLKIKPTEPEDALLIQFSGHGTSREQRFYLLPHNFTDAKELELRGVSDAELNQYLENVDAGRLLMVIDACQSGQALGEESEGRAPMNSKGLAQLAYDKGMLILTAAQSQQSAREAVRIGGREIKHGLLTYALLEAMRNPQANADRDGNLQLSEREWFDFAVEQVPLLQTERMKKCRADSQKGFPSALDPDDSGNYCVQTPRVFYRREAETVPLILARP